MTAAELLQKALIKAYLKGYSRRQILVLLSLAKRGGAMSLMELVEDTKQIRQTVSKTVSSYTNGEVRVDRSAKIVAIHITQQGVDSLKEILNTQTA